MKTKFFGMILMPLLFFSMPLLLFSQSKLGAEYYSNDFEGLTILDGATKAVVGSSTSAISLDNKAMKATLTNMLQYEVIGNIEFANAIDLTKNTNITIRSKWDAIIADPVPSTGQADFKPSVCLYLIDELGAKTGGDNNYWQIQITPQKDVWTTSTVNLKQFPANVDFTKIKKIELRYYSSNKIVSGNLLFDFIYLGNVPSPRPIQNRTTFINKYQSVFVSDIIQSTQSEKGGHYQQEGKLTIPVNASYSSWNTYYTMIMNKPIDISDSKTMKISMEVVNGAVGSGERLLSKEFSPRLIDANGKRCVLNGSALNDATKGVYTLNFATGFLEDGVFDYTKVKEFRLMSGPTNPGQGTLLFDYMQIGMDIIPTDLSLVSVSNSSVVIGCSPAITQFSTKDILIISDHNDTLSVKSINTSDSGASYTIDVALPDGKMFFLEIVKDGIYQNQSLSFDNKGTRIIVNPSVKKTEAGLIRILLDKQVILDVSHFSLLNLSNNTPISITKVTSIYEGMGYDIECAIQPGISANMFIQKEGYVFGEPVFVRMAKNPSVITVDWNTTIAPITSMHWGVNDYAASHQNTYDAYHVEYLKTIQPGLIRIHRAGLVNNWTNSTTRDWDKEKIKQVLTNAQGGHQNSKVLLCIDEWPSWLHNDGALPISKEQELIDLVAKLPGVIKELGFKVDYYEFLNERDNLYQNAGRISDLWDLLKRMAIKMKASHPGVKVGGPALTWPNSAWYQPFLNTCGEYIDFISWHNYASGDPSTTNASLFSNSLSQIGNSYPKGVIDFLKSKGWNQRMETFLDEFNVQWTWTPYEPRHHNHIGAAWMALLLKRVATQGVTGATVWNSKDGAYGLLPGDFYSAPAQMYVWGRNYLRGNLKKTSDDASGRLELLPVENQGVKSLLVVNKSEEEATLLDLYKIMGVSTAAQLKGLVLDATTKVSDKKYTTKVLTKVENDLLVQPYGSVMITTASATPVNAPKDLAVEYLLHDEVKLTWRNQDLTRSGFQIKINEEVHTVITDTFVVLRKLNPKTPYNIAVSTVNEFGQITSDVTTSKEVTTYATPLIINDRTIGSGLHQMNFSPDWSMKIDKNGFNNDYTSVAKQGASMDIQIQGRLFVIYAYSSASSGDLEVFVDDQKVKTIETKNGSNFGLVFYSNTLSDGVHRIKLVSQSSSVVGIDKILVYGSRFENVTQAPNAVDKIQEVATYSTISLNWNAPSSVSGIQKYIVSMIDRADTTVYSPFITFDGVQPETKYTFIIKSVDPCDNFTTSIPFDITTPKKVVVDIYQKSPSTESITIDGKELETAWANLPEYLITNYVGTPCTAENLSASFKVMWDNSNLYIFLKVRDDKKLVGIAGSPLVENDGFELFLDGSNKKAGIYSKTDTWFQYQYNPFLLKEYYNNNAWLTTAKEETMDGYNVEMRYRWSGIGMYTIAKGQELGLEIHVNDNDKSDASGLDNKLTWQLNTWNVSQNTALMANMILADQWTAILDLSLEKLNIYPNPAISQVTVSVPQEEFIIELLSLNGEVKKMQRNNPILLIEDCPQGIYLLKVTTSDKRYVSKLIKQ